MSYFQAMRPYFVAENLLSFKFVEFVVCIVGFDDVYAVSSQVHLFLSVQPTSPLLFTMFPACLKKSMLFLCVCARRELLIKTLSNRLKEFH